MFPGLRKYIALALQKYDNLRLSQEYLDKKLIEFSMKVDKLQQTQGSDEIFLDDVSFYSAQYLYALRSLLRSAESEIIVFTDQLDRTLANGTLLYSDPDIINIIMTFLRQQGTRLTVLARRAITTDYLKHHPLFSEVINSDQFQLYCATSKRVRKCECKCVVVDKKAYNFRVGECSWISFNNPDTATKFLLSIEKAIRLPTTRKLDLRLLDESLAA